MFLLRFHSSRFAECDSQEAIPIREVDQPGPARITAYAESGLLAWQSPKSSGLIGTAPAAERAGVSARDHLPTTNTTNDPGLTVR